MCKIGKVRFRRTNVYLSYYVNPREMNIMQYISICLGHVELSTDMAQSQEVVIDTSQFELCSVTVQ